ncbi:MAG: helix-turn-helix transcriptional regulator [Clostridia bacterium]|nr:helix-turn-helix transcriptional regulator [Clostridia bacterium]
MQPLDFLSNLCISELCSVFSCPMEKDRYPIENNGRICHGFMYTVSGTETYHFKDKTIKSEPGTVIYVPENEVYTITFEGETSNVLGLNFKLSTEFPRPFIIKLSEQNNVGNLFSNAERKWRTKKTGYYPECLSLFYNLISLFLNQEINYLTLESFKAIIDATEYLHHNFTDNTLRVDKLAKMSGISTKHFETLFFRKFSMTPKEYIILLKIEKAKELLQNQQLLIGDIAIMLGYSDIYHFSKIFKSKTGYSPREYIKSFR